MDRTDRILRNLKKQEAPKVSPIAGSGDSAFVLPNLSGLSSNIDATSFLSDTYVPYTGATSDVDLGANSLSANSLGADTLFIGENPNILTIVPGSITSQTGNISFGDENLTTTGNLIVSTINPVGDLTINLVNSKDLVITLGGTPTLTLDESGGGHPRLTSSDGTVEFGSDISATNLFPTNWNTAYTHSQDNTQAHTDYLLNNADDATTGALNVIGQFVAGTGTPYSTWQATVRGNLYVTGTTYLGASLYASLIYDSASANNSYIQQGGASKYIQFNTNLTNHMKIDSTGGIFLYSIKSGATQAGAGAAAGEIWRTVSHATLPNNVLMIGV